MFMTEPDAKAIAGKLPRLELGPNRYSPIVDVGSNWLLEENIIRVRYRISETNTLEVEKRHSMRDPGVDLADVVKQVTAINADRAAQQAVFEMRYPAKLNALKEPVSPSTQQAF
jgi:hypothetical protein